MTLCFATSLSGQDLLTHKVPTDQKMKDIDSLSTHRLAERERFSNPATALYADEEHNFTDADLIELIMQEAFSHLGARYRSGGKGPAAFDCSGFTGYVFGQSDYSIGASSRDQYAKNIPVERSQMRRGDLVFFTSPRSGKQVGHVGIVVSVNPANDTFTFIHASTNRGVVVSENTEGYYARRFVGVRRVF